MSKHTPGPWKTADITSRGTHVYWRIEAPSKHVAGVSVDVTLYPVDVVAVSEELKANARLIAAAPDLLAALEALEVAVSMDFSLDRDSRINAAASGARAAIAKARGES